MRRRGPAVFTANGGDPAAEDVAFWAQAGAAGAGGVAQEGVGVLPIGPDGQVDYGGFDGGDFGGGKLKQHLRRFSSYTDRLYFSDQVETTTKRYRLILSGSRREIKTNQIQSLKLKKT